MARTFGSSHGDCDCGKLPRIWVSTERGARRLPPYLAVATVSAISCRRGRAIRSVLAVCSASAHKKAPYKNVQAAAGLGPSEMGAERRVEGSPKSECAAADKEMIRFQKTDRRPSIGDCMRTKLLLWSSSGFG